MTAESKTTHFGEEKGCFILMGQNLLFGAFKSGFYCTESNLISRLFLEILRDSAARQSYLPAHFAIIAKIGKKFTQIPPGD